MHQDLHDYVEQYIADIENDSRLKMPNASFADNPKLARDQISLTAQLDILYKISERLKRHPDYRLFKT